jgi:diguanylate cyclase (GGDEF)-like protein
MHRSITRLIILVLVIVAPLCATFLFHTLPPKHLLFYYLVNTLLFIALSRNHTVKSSQLRYRVQTGQELLNMSDADNRKLQEQHASLEERMVRYDGLKKIIEELNQQMDPDKVTLKLASGAYTLVADRKGECLVFLVDETGHRLSLGSAFATPNEHASREREADMLDWWVIKHQTPLFIEDISRDFRFDLEKLSHAGHSFGSAIIAPLMTGKVLLGVARLDNSQTRVYTQDDLRLLMTICGLGAVALENSKMFVKMQELATHDELTSLYSKGYFLDLLKLECRRDIRHSGEFSILMIDIDNFKPYNDAFGHTMGDAVLKNIALTMQESLKSLNPVIGRFGGEEFCVILPGLNKSEATRVADNLRLCVERSRITLRRQETGVTVSIGVATYPFDDADYEGLLRRADKAMYQAKEGGRNRVCPC